MATIQSSFPRLQASAQGSRVPTGIMVTPVTLIRPPANRQPMPRPSSLLNLPNEPEDAKLTGGTRSLDRRLLALNLSGSAFRSEARKGMSSPERVVATPRSAA
jgi:hypothetical protein